MNEEKKAENGFLKTVYRLVSERIVGDRLNQFYDVISTIALILNLAASFLMTFDEVMDSIGNLLLTIEAVTVLFFAIDYFLRFLSARYQYPALSPAKATLKYVFSLYGIVDLLSFLPYYLPVLFPIGAAAFRLLRLARVLRLFRINAYYDSLHVIMEVLKNKKQQLLSSVFIISVLILASSLGMYGLEHEAQPDKFTNAFSGIWWASAALLTVGYGDIYPVTVLGRILGLIITFLGVGMVAIPTGIISAGFVEQYELMRRKMEHGKEHDLLFVNVFIQKGDSWEGRLIKELGLPTGLMVAVIRRKKRTLIPRGHVKLLAGDRVVLAAEASSGDSKLDLRETQLLEDHPWIGQQIKNINISRQTVLLMVKRDEQTLMPRGDLELRQGDRIIAYSSMEEVLSE
ncbi:MAG: ion transporter [Lachnospiraceae bacterium]|nr:ion transporter [Lachnospiraceae bacterium]